MTPRGGARENAGGARKGAGRPAELDEPTTFSVLLGRREAIGLVEHATKSKTPASSLLRRAWIEWLERNPKPAKPSKPKAGRGRR